MQDIHIKEDIDHLIKLSELTGINIKNIIDATITADEWLKLTEASLKIAKQNEIK